MKKIIYSLFVCLACTLASCEDETSQDISKVSYFVNFDMKGDATTLVRVGTQYVEAGVIATEGETDITASMKITGTVDATKVGVYTISYSATNVDGFAKSVQRTVVVYNPEVTTDISGAYKLAEGSVRVTVSSGAKIPFSGYDVNVKKLAPGVFEVSDFIGGYYDQRVSYGAAYALKGTMKLNEDNTLNILSGFLAGWGDSYTSFEDAGFNSAEGSLKWNIGYAGFMFNIILTK